MKNWALVFITIVFTGLAFWSCSNDENTTEPTNTPPSCEITSPSDSSIFLEGDSLTFEVIAVDDDGTIENVRFFIDNSELGSDSVTPYRLTLSSPIFLPGIHFLKTISIDNDGLKKTDSLYFGIIPKAPTALSVFQDNVNTFTLNWIDNSLGEDGFKIERKIDDGAYTVIATVTETNYVDNTVSKGYGTVFYRVRAFKGDTYYSEYASTNSAVSFPSPSDLTITHLSISSANIAWTDNSIGEDKFDIERKLSTEATYEKITEIVGSDTELKNWTDINILPNLTYDYRIIAVKGLNNSAYVSKSYENVFQAPSTLTLSQINVYTFTLNWIDNSEGEDGFKIERKIDDSAFTEIKTTTTTSFVDSTLAKKGFVTVYYRVRAYKADYYSFYTSQSSSVAFPAPSDLNIIQSSITSASLSWKDNSLGEDKFEIERKLSTESSYIKIADVPGNNISTQSWVDTNLVLNNTYDYRIKAVKGSFSSDYVNSSLVNVFSDPTNLSIIQTSLTSCRLAWTDNSIIEDHFEIERKLSTDPEYIKIAEVVGDNSEIKSWTDTNLIIGLTYEYRLRAFSNSYFTNYIYNSFENIMSPPTEFKAVTNTDSSIKLTWKDNTLYENGFKIDRKIGSTGSWVIDYASLSANATNWINTGLSAGTTYYYRIRAYYSSYFSNYTNEIAFTLINLNKFVSVPIGSFSMGGIYETPIHTVSITKPYYLGKYEVTQKEWSEIMVSNPSHDYGMGDNYPVYNVTWYDIIVYCNKRSIIEGLSPCYTINGSTDPAVWGIIPTVTNAIWNAVICDFSANGYRLPTEAEWEYAARYNDGRTYPWGNTLPSSSICNYGNYFGSTTPIGTFTSGKSYLGLWDLSGNVGEWVWDWYGSYQSIPVTDPTGPASGSSRILRSGSWFDTSEAMRSAFRFYRDPSFVANYGRDGFRLARSK